ncbi:MAG: NADH-quinone oxidoreductase subunit A [Neisseria sp.]
MLANYFPVFVFIIIGLVAGLLFLTLGNLLGPKRHYAEKDTPFECGFEAFETARMRFDVRYYLVAILFILFDLEIAFMFPWAVVFKDLGAFGFWSMFVFIVILTVGFIYEWKKGALEWE